nr:basic proline-rich protein-like [Taeniopygia guttata]
MVTFSYPYSIGLNCFSEEHYSWGEIEESYGPHTIGVKAEPEYGKLQCFVAQVSVLWNSSWSSDCRNRVPLPGARSQFTPAGDSRSWHNGAARKGNPFPRRRWCADKEGMEEPEQQPQAPKHSPAGLGRRDGNRLTGHRGQRAPGRCQRDSLRIGVLAASPVPGARSDPAQRGRRTMPAPGLPRPGCCGPAPPLGGRRSPPLPPRPPASLELSPGSRNKRPTPGCRGRRCSHNPLPLPPSSPQAQPALGASKIPANCPPGMPGTAPEKSPPPPPLPSRSHLTQPPPSLARPPAPPASPPAFPLPTPPWSANAHPRPLPLPQSQTRAELSAAAGSPRWGRADLPALLPAAEAKPLHKGARQQEAGDTRTPGRSVRMR